MAFIYTAALSPDKPEWIRRFLIARGLPEDVTAERVGAFRFDDPAGEVGVECMVARVGERLFLVPLSYRGEPREGAVVVCEAEHSVLGHRWIHDASTDPEAAEILRQGVRGEIPQEAMEMHDADGTFLETRRPDTTVRSVGRGDGELDLPFELEQVEESGVDPDGPRTLVAAGDGFTAVVGRLA